MDTPQDFGGLRIRNPGLDKMRPLPQNPSLDQMDPPISETVIQIGPKRWSIGSSILCDEVDRDPVPPESIVSWKDGVTTYGLSFRNDPISDLPNPCSFDFEPIHVGGSKSAVWILGQNTIIKVNAWVEGLTCEADNIWFLRTNVPHVPLPEVLGTFVDSHWSRTIIFMRCARGVRLDRAFPSLAYSQIRDVARQVAAVCADIGKLSSPHMQSVTGGGVMFSDDLLGDPDHKPMQDWQASIHPVLTPTEVQERVMTRQDSPEEGERPATCSPIEEGKFWLYNSDLNPKNIFVNKVPASSDDKVQVTTIVDWECLGYFPRWWIPMKPRSNPAFIVDTEQDDERRAAWMCFLSEELAEAGFPMDYRWCREFLKRTLRALCKKAGYPKDDISEELGNLLYLIGPPPGYWKGRDGSTRTPWRSIKRIVCSLIR